MTATFRRPCMHGSAFKLADRLGMDPEQLGLLD
jgi:hypothetical protein